jgi:hypothetical protein
MPCLVGLGLAFLVNLCWQNLLELLQGDNPNRLNFEEFMNKAGFYVVQLHQLVEIKRVVITQSFKSNVM